MGTGEGRAQKILVKENERRGYQAELTQGAPNRANEGSLDELKNILTRIKKTRKNIFNETR